MSGQPTPSDPFGVTRTLATQAGEVTLYSLLALEEQGICTLGTLPFSIRVLLEAALRQVDGFEIQPDDVRRLGAWVPEEETRTETPFKPGRVVLQDFTGVPSVVDLAALRSAAARLGADPQSVNPEVPVDLVIDHSVQVDRFGSSLALRHNSEIEFRRNRERYEFLRWGQEAFERFRVVPPATGIVHQVNLEYLARCVMTREVGGRTIAFPDSLVGTDSHTTMINGLAVLGWGVGGIEAEAVMLGQPIYMLTPDVVGFRLDGALAPGATATDLVLTVTQMLRNKGVVGKFVEFFGPGVSRLSLADRATIANMAPEYGATMGFFPIDEETLRYLRLTGRDAARVDLVERYAKEQGLFRTDDQPAPGFTDTLSLDMSTVETSLAGPKRPQDRIPLRQMKRAFFRDMKATFGRPFEPTEEHQAYAAALEAGEALPEPGSARRDLYHPSRVPIRLGDQEVQIGHGAVVIAAITSCTNTSNPAVMLGAGLLAKKAVERGLQVKPWVKTSLAPGSRVVTGYLAKAGLLPFLEALRFHVVGYGCTTCIGNSGPLPEPVRRAIVEHDLATCAVLSGNRNFEGRVSPYTLGNYLASPPLVVAYALCGTVDIDFDEEPLGFDPGGDPVYLREVWPTQEEVQGALSRSVDAGLFAREYADVLEKNPAWNEIPTSGGDLYPWNPESTYIQEPPFFTTLTLEEPRIGAIEGARCLALLGDSTTTDHISPAGTIAEDSPAARYLLAHGVEKADWNSYGSRRGNHEVMMRGTFANIRIKNELVPGVEGGVTRHLPTGDQLAIWDAAERYLQEGTPLIVIAGRDYGMGSSRDWAAKGPYLQGLRATIAESYERIHRSNLVGMGILPLEFLPGEGRKSLALTGEEVFFVQGLSDDLEPGQQLTVCARAADGTERRFAVKARIDTPIEVTYYRNGGILHTVLRRLAREGQAAQAST